MPGSSSWEDPDWNNASKSYEPDGTEQRASDSLRSPDFQQQGETDFVEQSAASARATPDTFGTPVGQVSAPNLFHRRSSDSDVEARRQQRDQEVQADSVRARTKALNDSDPYQSPDGRWKVKRADPSGTISEYDATQFAKTDPHSGERRVKLASGAELTVGVDDAVAERRKLLAERQALSLQQQVDGASLSDAEAALVPLKERLDVFGKEGAKRQGNVDKFRAGLDPNNPDPTVQRQLATSERLLADWHKQNPQYATVKSEFDAQQAQIDALKEQRRSRRWQILSTQIDPTTGRRLSIRPTRFDTGEPDFNGTDLNPKAVQRLTIEGSKGQEITPTMATLGVLHAAKKRGAQTIGGKPIDEEIARLTPANPGDFAKLHESPEFQTGSSDAKVKALKGWVDAQAKYQKSVNPKFDEKAFRGQFVDRSGAWGAIKELGAGIVDALTTQFPKDLASIWRAGNITSLKDQTWVDKLYAERSDAEGKSPKSYQYLAGNSLAKGFKEGPASVATSAAVSIPGAIGGAKVGGAIGAAVTPEAFGAGAVPGGAIGAIVGGAGASGAAFYRLGQDNFVSQLRDKFAEKFPKATDAEWNAYRTSAPVQSAMRKYGLIEGGVEAASTALTAGIFHGGGKLLTKALGSEALDKLAAESVKTAARRGATLLGKVALEQGQEVGTETLQQKWESDIEAQFGIRAKGKTYGEAFSEVLAPTLVGGALHGTAHAGIEALQQRLKKQFAEVDSSANDLDDAFAEQKTAETNGDQVGAAQAEEKANDALSEVHSAARQALDEIPPETRKQLSRLASLDADFAANDAELQQDPVRFFAATEIGRSMREAGAGRNTPIEQVAQNKGIDSNSALMVADQHAGLSAVNELVRFMENGEALDPNRAAVFSSLGLLDEEQDLDGTMRVRVTDDALNLMPPAVRQRVAQNPDAFDIADTPGATGDLVHNLVRSGVNRFRVSPAPVSAIALAPSQSAGGEVTEATTTAPTPLESQGGLPTEGSNSLSEGVAPSVDTAPKPGTETDAAKTSTDDDETPGLGQVLAHVRVTREGGEDDRTSATPNARGEITVNIRPDHVGTAQEREEWIHAASLNVLRRQWMKQGKPGNFIQFAKADALRRVHDLKRTLESLTGESRDAFADAIVASHNLYNESYSKETPEVQTAEQVIEQLLSDPSELHAYSFIHELVRQGIQLRQSGQISEQSLSDWVESAMRWIREALEELRAFAATLTGAEQSQVAELIRQTEAELASWENQGAPVDESQAAPSLSENGQHNRVADADRPEGQTERTPGAGESRGDVSGVAGDAGPAGYAEPADAGVLEPVAGAAASGGDAAGAGAGEGSRRVLPPGRKSKAKAPDIARFVKLKPVQFKEAIADRKVKDSTLLALHEFYDRGGNQVARIKLLENEMEARARRAQAQEAEQSIRQTAGSDLATVVRSLGGLPTVSKGYEGELKRLRESPAGRRPGTFRKDAPSIPQLRESLEQKGFNFPTENDLIDALEAWMFRKETILPTGRSENQNYADDRGGRLASRLSPAETERWSTIQRRLQEIEKQNGGLNPQQRAMLRKADEALGQRSLLDVGESQKPEAEHPRPTFNRSKQGGQVASQDTMFDERPSGGGVYRDGDQQGSLFSRVDRNQGDQYDSNRDETGALNARDARTGAETLLIQRPVSREVSKAVADIGQRRGSQAGRYSAPAGVQESGGMGSTLRELNAAAGVREPDLAGLGFSQAEIQDLAAGARYKPESNTLQDLGGDAESWVYADDSWVYKVFPRQVFRTFGNTDGFGLTGKVAVDTDGTVDATLVPASPQELIQRAALMSALGTPTEFHGFDPDAQVAVIKQPRADTSGVPRIRQELQRIGAVPVSDDERSNFYDEWAVFVSGRPYLLMDIHGGNVGTASDGSAKLFDVVFAPIPTEAIRVNEELRKAVVVAAHQARTLPDRAAVLFARGNRGDSTEFFNFGVTSQPGEFTFSGDDTPVRSETTPALALTPTPASTRIEDFGEKIVGARKDLWRSYRDKIGEVLPSDVADISLSKSFPEPDYELAIANGVPEDSLAAFKAIRDLIPVKPRKQWKLGRWGELVRTVHGLMQKLVTGDLERTPERLGVLASQTGSPAITKKIKLYQALGYPAFQQASDWTISSGLMSVWNGQRMDRPTSVVYAMKDGRVQPQLAVVGNEIATQDAEARVASMIRQRIETDIAAPKAGGQKPIEFSIYHDRFTSDVFIGKKGLSGVIRLKTGFPDAKQAREYLKDRQGELEEQWRGLKEVPDYRRAINEPRQGPPRRNSDVAAQMFQEAFGFRGVQFGNWVEDDRRQVDLNEAFDALMDLSEALGVPARALSLDGSLGLAFGARGTGGAKAHYEPGEVVINITKKKGPGSLAHEWFHAFDNYFARLDRTGTTAPKSLDAFASSNLRPAINIRPEVWSAFKRIRDAVSRGTFADRSAKLDEARSKPYFSTTIEKAARAFERYVVNRLSGKEVSNDYLVNLVKEDSPQLPTEKEMSDGITEAYDVLFNTLDTKETDRGVQLFSRGDRFFDFGVNSQPGELRLSGPSLNPGRTDSEPVAAKSVGELVKENLGLAVSIAGEYRNIPGTPIEDIVSEARKRLVQAARSFDPERRTPFAAYASRVIRNGLNDLYGRERKYSAQQTTLDEPSPLENGSTAKDQIPAEAIDPTLTSAQQDTEAELQRALDALPLRMREVVEAILDGKTVEQIGTEQGVSKQRISKLAIGARERMRVHMESRGLSGVASDGTLYSRPSGQIAPLGNTDWIDVNERLRPHRVAAVLFESGMDVLRRQQSPTAQRLADAMQKRVDVKAEVESRLALPVERAMEGLDRKAAKKAKAEVSGYQRIKESQGILFANAYESKMSAEGRKLLASVKQMFNTSGSFAVRKGVQVWDEKLNGGNGGYRPARNLGGNYWPRILKDEVQRVIENPDKYAKLKAKYVAILQAAGWTPEKINTFFATTAPALLKRDDFFGQLEMARSMDKLPAEFYEYDFDRVIPSFIGGYSNRMSQILAYGQKLRRDPTSTDLFDEAQVVARNEATREFIQRIQKLEYRISERTGWNKFTAQARTLATGLLLANPFTTVPRNLISGVLANTEMLGTVRTFKALGAMARGAVTQMTAKQLGTLKANILDAMEYNDEELTAGSAIRRFANWTLQKSGYNASEAFVRTLATATSMQWITDYLNAPLNSAASQEAEAFMRRVSIDPAEIRKEAADFKQGVNTRNLVRRMVADSQFGYDNTQVPVWENGPTGRLFYQYGRWGTQRARTLWKHVFEPAIFGELVNKPGHGTIRVRRMKPIATALATMVSGAVKVGGIGIVTGEVFAAIAQLLFKRDRDDEDWDVIFHELSQGEEDAVKHLTQRLGNDLLLGGMLGVLSQPVDMVKSWMSGSRFKNPIEPPASSIPRSTYELLRSWYERGAPYSVEDIVAGHGNDLWTAIRSLAPGVSAGYDTVANLGAAVTNDVDFLEAKANSRSVANLRKAARRFAEQTGIEAGGMFDGRFARRPQAATYDRLQEALMLGDLDKAQKILDEYVERFGGDDPTKALRGISASMRQRQPVKVGAHTGEDVKQDFMEWAEKHVAPGRLQEFQKIQETYEGTARQLGLMN